MSENLESHSGPLAVELHGISKSFPGVIANYSIELMVRPGTIHAIVGENGAGKSTLMKTLYGMHQPDEGTITVNGHAVQFKTPTEAIAAGIGMVHQHFMLADNLTIIENIILGAEPTDNRGRINFGAARERIEVLRKIDHRLTDNQGVTWGARANRAEAAGDDHRQGQQEL